MTTHYVHFKTLNVSFLQFSCNTVPFFILRMISSAADGVFCIQEGIVVNVNILKNSTLVWNPKSLTMLGLLISFSNYNIHETVNNVKVFS